MYCPPGTVVRTRFTLALVLVASLITTAASATDAVRRPTDAKLRSGILFLIKNLKKEHAGITGFNDDVISRQIQKLPRGRATDAGWLLEWKYIDEEHLYSATVPWPLLGQDAPKNLPVPSDIRYSGGEDAAPSVVKAISSYEERLVGKWFSAITRVRQSRTDSRWAIFTATPYLPVTDQAYGFAKKTNKGWTVIDTGTFGVGCNTVPAVVLAEFKQNCKDI